MAGSCGEKIKKAPMITKTGVLPEGQEYLLASATCLLTTMGLVGSIFLIQRLIKKRRKCGIQFVIYMSILIGNALMSLTTMPMSVYIILAYRVPLSKDKDVFEDRGSQFEGAAEQLFCNISGYIFNVTRSTTLWSVCFFTFDRFLYVCFPFMAKRVVKYWHYTVVAVIIWLYFLSFSASPYMFAEQYKHLSFEGLACSWTIMDIIPQSLVLQPNQTIPYNVLLPYAIALNYIPTFLPVLLISVFSIAVVVELAKIHRKSAPSRNMITAQSLSKKHLREAPADQSPGYTSLYGKMMQYLHSNREVKLSIIMLLTTIGFIVCYGLWIYIYAIHLGMLLCLVDFSVLYVHSSDVENSSSVISRLYNAHELVGFAHAAIQPLILYMVLAKPPKRRSDQMIRLMTSPYQSAKVSPKPIGNKVSMNGCSDSMKERMLTR